MKCVYCELELEWDAEFLIDSTGGDACGVPLDNGAEHAHCRGFAPDSWGSDATICIECLVHQDMHPDLTAAS